MKKAGGIISLVASVLATIMAFVTLFIGGVGGALEAEGASTVAGLGWAGLFLSFVIIVFAATSISASGKLPSVFVMLLSIVTAITGGTLVAIFMVLSLLGGILAFIGVRKEQKEDQLQQGATVGESE